MNVNLVTGLASGGDAEGDRVSGLEVVIGSNNADTLIGGSGAVNLFGHDGDDLVVAGSGNGYFDGGSGRDSLFYSALARGVTVNLATGLATSTALAGSDTIIGIEDVFGTSFSDLLTGDAGDNSLMGADGADTLAGGAGNDTLEGKGGGDLASDTADYSGETAFVTIDLDVAAGSAVGASSGSDLLLEYHERPRLRPRRHASRAIQGRTPSRGWRATTPSPARSGSNSWTSKIPTTLLAAARL